MLKVRLHIPCTENLNDPPIPVKYRLKGHHVSQDLSFVLNKIFPVKAFIKHGVPHGL